MKKFLILIISLFLTGPCFALESYKGVDQFWNSYKKDVVEMTNRMDVHKYGTDIQENISFMLTNMYAAGFDEGSYLDQLFINKTIICNLRNELGLLHKRGYNYYKQNGVTTYEAVFEQVQTLKPQYKNMLCVLLQKDIMYIYDSKQNWTKEEKALREFVYNLQNADDTFDWYKIYTVIPPDTDRNEHTIRPLGG